MRVCIVPEKTGFIYGVPLPEVAALPVQGAPDGARIRLRFRNNGFGRAYVKTADCIREYVIRATDTALVIDPEFQQGENRRA